MHSKPPFFKQERSDTCAIACLRMILAKYGQTVTEEELFREAQVDGGIWIDELARLAKHRGLQAGIQILDHGMIMSLLSQDVYPIVFVNRKVLDQESAIHAMIPIRATSRTVTVRDPRLEVEERRIPRRLFDAARVYFDFRGVVCRCP